MMHKAITPLISSAELLKRTAELGREISRDYNGKTLTLVCILKGGVMFMTDLSKTLDCDVEFDFMDISSYSGTQSSGVVKINMDLKEGITGKHVLLVEDIIDTGHSLSRVVSHLKGQMPASLKVCTLLDKPDRRVVNEVVPDYVGFTIEDKFVVGYGLDYNQKFRNLDYIGVLNVEEL
jgi:hypoxanthine phosphoribosyltransferase